MSNRPGMLHVRYQGRSYDLNENVGTLTDDAIKERVAQFLEVGLDKLQLYVVDRRPNGQVIVRPEAVYG